jgi:cellulose synthase/poly-beta-1,6-N-acetylglucosamine synthase-like glycosyltransferase
MMVGGLVYLKKKTNHQSLEKFPIVSVVIAVRNEAKNLTALLNDLVAQDYPHNKLEVIVVDDRSTDNSWKIIQTFSRDYLNFKGIQITIKSKTMTPKKFALTQGISTAIGEIILSTDGDCRVPATWVSSMTAKLGNNVGIVSGFSSIQTKHNYFHIFQKIDFLALMISNAGALGAGFSWAGTGQNLAYKKKYFEKIDGFNPVSKSISGDDIYLIQSISKIKKVAFNLDKKGAVSTLPVDSLSQFINQRIRWSSNATGQFFSRKWFLLFLSSVFLLNISILLQIIVGTFSMSLLMIIFIKLIIDGLLMFTGSRTLKMSVPIPMFIVWFIIQPIYIPVIGLLGVSGLYSWKP